MRREVGTPVPPYPRVLFTPEDVLGDFARLSLETARAIRVHRLVAAAEGTPARAVDALARLRRSVAT